MSLIDDLNNNKYPVIAAPLAGYTDPPLASILLPMGIRYLIYPFISSEGIVKTDTYRKQILNRITEWKKLIPKGCVHVQIFGRDASIMAQSAVFLEEELDVDIIDINMGCSVRKIWKSNSGSWLLQTPQVALEIIESVIDSVKIPVTLKTRTGWDNNDENGLLVIKEAEMIGVSSVTLHPRRAKDQFKKSARWDDIKRIRGNVSIPIIGNGDISSPEDARRMIDETGCNGIMIGRASIGNPWLLRRCEEYIQKGVKLPEPSSNERIKTCVKHIEALVSHRGEKVGIRESRKHVGRYLKSIPRASEIRKEIVTKDSIAEVKAILSNHKDRLLLCESEIET